MYKIRCPLTKQIKKYACLKKQIKKYAGSSSRAPLKPSLFLLYINFTCTVESSKRCLPLQPKTSDAHPLQWTTF
jgi:hypothetical protein